MKFYLLFTALFLFVNCSNNDDNSQGSITCTEEFVSGINLQVIDASTDTIIPQGITVTIKDGDYTEVLTFSFDTFFGAGERPGNYIITAMGNGYISKTIGPIEVTEDECHVIPVQLEISLTPN